MAATSLSAEILLSSNSTRAEVCSRLTSARFTPGSLSKAVAAETGQALQTIPLTWIVATFGAAWAMRAVASDERHRQQQRPETVGDHPQIPTGFDRGGTQVSFERTRRIAELFSLPGA